ncbi:type II toxin-antitoxin system Phd/YefM family antitoxin [Pedobacter endophyticus]|nr:prevent-host-death protein [Pedobacter endophyticus]
MKTMSVGEFKSHLAEAIEEVKAGGEIAVTYGKKKEIIGYFVPTLENAPKIEKTVGKRKLGPLNGKAQVIFADDFKMTTEEFLGL